MECYGIVYRFRKASEKGYVNEKAGANSFCVFVVVSSNKDFNN